MLQLRPQYRSDDSTLNHSRYLSDHLRYTSWHAFSHPPQKMMCAVMLRFWNPHSTSASPGRPFQDSGSRDSLSCQWRHNDIDKQHLSCSVSIKETLPSTSLLNIKQVRWVRETATHFFKATKFLYLNEDVASSHLFSGRTSSAITYSRAVNVMGW